MTPWLHQIHLGNAPEGRTLQCITTASEFHRGQYTLWNEERIESEFPLLLARARHNHHKYAGMADLIRLHILLKHGGISIDTDVECFAPLWDFCQYPAFAAFQKNELLCNAVFGAEAGHEWVAAQIERAEHYCGWEGGWGPHCMSDVPLVPRRVRILPPEELGYSWWWDTPASERVVKPGVRCLHHWAGTWVA